MIKPEAILFDMDGVLVDSFESWYHALNDALNHFHHEKISKEEFTQRYWGHDLYENLKKMNLSEEIGPVCNTYFHNHIDKIKLYKGTKKTLQKLDQFKKGIITNTPHDCAKLVVHTFDIAKYFDTIATSDQVQKGKPDPALLYKACNDLHVDPSKAIVIGDTESDIRAGNAAGCTVIGLRISAEYTIQELPELIKLLDL